MSQVWKNIICSSSVSERSSQRRTEQLRTGVITGENEITNRRRILAADGHLCVHTIGSSGLFVLGHSFHVPQPKIDRICTTNATARRESSM